jgi:hypothetical protein
VLSGVDWVSTHRSCQQRNTDAEKEAIKAGKTANEIWPNKAGQKDTDARWTLKIGGKIRYRPDGRLCLQSRCRYSPAAYSWPCNHETIS